jgi:hypothetical protein
LIVALPALMLARGRRVAATTTAGDTGPAATGETGAETGTTGDDVPTGGILREETTDFGFTNAFDLTGEYLGSVRGRSTATSCCGTS